MLDVERLFKNISDNDHLLVMYRLRLSVAIDPLISFISIIVFLICPSMTPTTIPILGYHELSVFPTI